MSALDLFSSSQRLVGTPDDLPADSEQQAGLLAALDLLGITEVYRVGGVQAVGAMAFGTTMIPAVDKVFGPGNAYVASAKKHVFGQVGIDIAKGVNDGLKEAMNKHPKRYAGFAHLPLTIFERLAAGFVRWLPGLAQSLPLWRGLQERSHRLWFPPIDPTRWLFYLDNAGQIPIAELARRFGMLRGFDVRSSLPQLTTPTLLLHVEGEGESQTRCRDELAALAIGSLHAGLQLRCPLASQTRS